MKNRKIIIALVALLSTSTILVACVVGYKAFQFLQDNKIEMSMDSEVEPAKEDIVETVEAETDAVDNETDNSLVENNTNEIDNETVEVKTETTENENSEDETETEAEDEFEEAPLSEGETAVELKETTYEYDEVPGFIMIETENGIEYVPDTMTPVIEKLESMTDEEIKELEQRIYKELEEESKRMQEEFEKANQYVEENLPELHIDTE